MAKASSLPVRIESGTSSHSFKMSERDFNLLFGPDVFLPACRDFALMLGVYDNVNSMLDTQPPSESTVERHRVKFLRAAIGAHHSISRDRDLLTHDYSFRLTKDESRSRLKVGLSGFHVRGRFASVSGTPKGFCTLELIEKGPSGEHHAIEVLDMRRLMKIETDDMGELRIYKTEATLGWLDAFPPLIDFLKSSVAERIAVRHDFGG